ncbi:MAG: hypothetical protein LBP28_05405 [Coriobacteriales bacterium]|nr:hypothetical protein [Coriobacteriales bacterium]
MTTEIELRAYAKINLYLGVEPRTVAALGQQPAAAGQQPVSALEQRAAAGQQPVPALGRRAESPAEQAVEQRHQLRSVFATVSLHDSLHFAFAERVVEEDVALALAAGVAAPAATGSAAATVAPPAAPSVAPPAATGSADAAPAVAGSATCLPVEVIVCAEPALALAAIAPEDNLITKAVRAFEAALATDYDRSVPASHLRVTLKKRIPAQAGLGGGSADAAATIQALAQHCGLSVQKDADFLHRVARAVGADVAFFLAGGCALMGGFGDVLEQRLPSPVPALDIVVIKPAEGLSTASVYAAFDAAPVLPAALEPLLGVLKNGGAFEEAAGQSDRPSCPRGSDLLARLGGIARSLANNLEPAAEALLPELARLKAELAARPGVLTARLCGSGSALFALCASPREAQNVAEHFAARGFWSRAAQTVSP